MNVKAAPVDEGSAQSEAPVPIEVEKIASDSGMPSHAASPIATPWVPLEEAGLLPRVDPATVIALNRLYRSHTTATFDIRGIPCVLRWQFQQRARSSERKYRFTLGKEEGFLGLDPFAESILHGGERYAGLLPRELRYLLIADALQLLVQRLETVTGLPFEWDPSAADEERLGHCDPERAAQFTLLRQDTGATCGGFIQFANNEALASAVTPFAPTAGQIPGEGFNGLPFPVHCQIGATRMPLSEMRSIEPGDIISIDESRSSASGLFVNVLISGHPPIQITGLAEGTRITLQNWKEDPMKPGTHPTDPTADPSGSRLPPDRLDGLEVPLQFEIGELTLSLADLKNVQPGYVFELTQPLNRNLVRILAHGNLLGTGYLVAIGDRLGVRVSEFIPTENE